MPTEPKTPDFVAKVRLALGKKRDSDAAALLVEGLSQSVVKKNTDLTPWLRSQFGAAGAKQLLKALAHFPCFYCKRGLLKCPSCGGRGRASGDWPCEPCVALGMARCDFCDGSGWATYNFVPVGLRLSVIIARVQAGSAELKVLLKKPPATASRGRPGEVAKAVSSQLLALNRLAGIFENALDATRAFRKGSTANKQIIQRIRKTCIAGWKKIAPRLRDCLAGLQRAAADEVAASNGAQKKYAQRKMDFYERLATAKHFMKSNTGIDHPFLARAAR
ncbi:MAG: hypothetical protein HS101_11135 [Planctomycetia bacterium]|nr:hypothetical protein [Planctomycetia bacterium]OQY97241.1 MAG: hypothetical protein B6D36_18785 [Planctomycetes bacterium UTPLA1]